MRKSDDDAVALLGLMLLMGGGGGESESVRVPTREEVLSPPRANTGGVLSERVAQVKTQWPMPILREPASYGGKTYPPTISDGFKTSRTDHLAADIMYKRPKERESGVSTFFRGGLLNNLRNKRWDMTWADPPNGTKWFFCPPGTPVRSFAHGRVWRAGSTSKGMEVLMDHGTWTSFYLHLDVLKIPPCVEGRIADKSHKDFGKKLFIGSLLPGSTAAESVVLAFSQTLGHVGADPTGPKSTPRHLHFEVAEYNLDANGKAVARKADPDNLLKKAESWILEMS